MASKTKKISDRVYRLYAKGISNFAITKQRGKSSGKLLVLQYFDEKLIISRLSVCSSSLIIQISTTNFQDQTITNKIPWWSVVLSLATLSSHATIKWLYFSATISLDYWLFLIYILKLITYKNKIKNAKANQNREAYAWYIDYHHLLSKAYALFGFRYAFRVDFFIMECLMLLYLKLLYKKAT